MRPAATLLNLWRLHHAYRTLPNANPAAPTRADIEPTTYCNFRCPHCPSTAASKTPGWRAHLSLAAFRRVLDELPAVYRIKLVGLGEPLLNPEFYDLVRAARRRHVRVLTTTNGSLLGDPDHRRELLSCGLSTLNVSIDAARADTHAVLRPGSNLEAIGDGLSALVRERGRRRRPAIRVWHVIQREAVQELPDLVTRCAEWGVDSLVCTAKITNFGLDTLEEVVGEMRAVREQMAAVVPEARRRAASAGLEFRCPDGPPPRRTPADGRPCRWPWSRTFVTARGEILPCPYASRPTGLVLGRLLPGEEGTPRAAAFQRIWNGAAMQSLREQVRERRNPAFCQACYFGWRPGEGTS